VVAEEKLTLYGILVLIIASFGGLLFGYHIAVISGALVFLGPVFQLSPYDEGIVVSIMLLGGLVGALAAGNLADRLGRKKTLFIMALLLTLGALIIAFSQIYVQLLVGRILSGVAIGIVSVVAPLYLAEVAPPHLRGRCVSAFQLFISLGILLSFGMAYHFSEDQRWQMLFFIGAFLAFLQLCGILFIPETPSWVLSHGKNAQAIRILGRLRSDMQWKKEMKHMHKKPEKKSGWVDFFKPHMPYILIVGFMLSIFQQITGVNAVIFYLPKIFQSAGISTNTGPFLASLSVGVINCLATLFSVWVIDKIGRRMLLLIGSFVMALSLGVLSFGFFEQSSGIDILALMSLMVFIASFSFSLGATTWVVLAEIFPLKIRSKAMACAMALNWLANYAISMAFPEIIATWGEGWSFAIIAMISFTSFLFVYWFISETKGKSLEEIETLVRAGKF